MLVSSMASLIKLKKSNFFFLSFGALFIDAINRLAIGVNHIYLYQVYNNIKPPPIKPGTVRVVTNLLPSHIILIIEIVLIIMVLRFFINIKSLIAETSS